MGSARRRAYFPRQSDSDGIEARVDCKACTDGLVVAGVPTCAQRDVLRALTVGAVAEPLAHIPVQTTQTVRAGGSCLRCACPCGTIVAGCRLAGFPSTMGLRIAAIVIAGGAFWQQASQFGTRRQAVAFARLLT